MRSEIFGLIGKVLVSLGNPVRYSIWNKVPAETEAHVVGLIFFAWVCRFLKQNDTRACFLPFHSLLRPTCRASFLINSAQLESTISKKKTIPFRFPRLHINVSHTTGRWSGRLTHRKLPWLLAERHQK